MDYETKIITIKNTRFIFDTNFEGKPDEKFGSTDRVANVVVPPAMVPELEAAGINVKSYPREPEEGQQITYFIKTKASWRNRYGELKDERFWPNIRLYRGRNTNPVNLDEDSAKTIDEIDIEEISVRLNPWQNQNGGITLYIQDLSVLQNCHDDPFGDMYGARTDEDEETLPFA